MGRPQGAVRVRDAPLLDTVGGLGVPDAGRVEVDGRVLAEPDEGGLLALRRDRVGFVFQSFGLLTDPTAAENVGLPMRLRRTAPREREERVELPISLVGLAGHTARRPGELSGGRQQRSPSPSPTAPPCSWPTSPPVSWTRRRATP